MRDLGDGFYLNSYMYYKKPEGERRFQVIYSRRDEGHTHIEDSVASNFLTEEDSRQWIENLKHDPDWKKQLDVKLISPLLNGCTTRYQLQNFNSLFSDWSEYERAIVLDLLAKRAKRLDAHNSIPNLDEIIRVCEAQLSAQPKPLSLDAQIQAAEAKTTQNIDENAQTQQER